MSTQPFAPGDLVELKSGGPCMTVDENDGLGQVTCSWFNGKERFKDTFAETSLKTYEKKSTTTTGYIGRY